MANVLPRYRAYDGGSNNRWHPSWGAAGTPLTRRATIGYSDGANVPAGSTRPNARVVSNQMCIQDTDRPSALRLTDLTWLWGQFVNHSLNFFPAADPQEDLSIHVPADDPAFPPGSMIPLTRSAFDIATGTDPGNPRQQITQLSSYMDGSTVYSINEDRAAALRTTVTAGPMAALGSSLRTSAGPDGPLMPMNTAGMDNELIGPSAEYFLAGDQRANTGFGLMAVHTLFVREHNRLVAELSARMPTSTPEDIYQLARKWVEALIQAITFEEWIPSLLGDDVLGPYTGYDPHVSAAMGNEFAAFGFRFGHTMLSPFLQVVDNDGNVLESMPHRDALLNIGVVQRYGIGPVFKGFASQIMQEIDVYVIEDMRSIHFPGAPPLDLVAVDLQRARDHGIPGYNVCRQCFGLPMARQFQDITSDIATQQRLSSTYSSIDDIDPLIGGLAEDHATGSALGPLLRAVVIEQFNRARAGDRYWYENDPAFSPGDVAELQGTKLSDIIKRNTEITNIQANVFVLP